MKRFGFLIVLTLLASCGADEPEVRPDPIVVYAPGDASSDFAALLADFTEDTKVPVSIKWGTSKENTDAVINKTGIPADILITDNVADIWRAADEGALRPIESEALTDVSDLVRDRDKYWTSLVVYTPAFVTTPGLGVVEGGYEGQHQSCVLSSKHPMGRAMIANEIQTDGLRTAERTIRRMVAALTRDPFESDADLLDAIRSGECAGAVVARATPDEGLTILSRVTDFVTIDAVGVGRHSRYPESAQLFVDWLIRERPVEVPDSLEIPVSIAGYRDEEARLLAERAGYR